MTAHTPRQLVVAAGAFCALLVPLRAEAHPDVTSSAGATAWGISAVIGLVIVGLIWWSARR